MIPSIFDQEMSSPGELRLFERFQSAPDTDDWTVLHSLELADHPSQVCGEVDFVVVVPQLGVLCIEVKAHKRIARDVDGNWLLGRQRPTPRSPFKQADDQMRSIMDFLRKSDPSLANVPVLCAVWFTNCRAQLPPSVEWHDWQLLDQDHVARPIAATVVEVLTKGRLHLVQKARGIRLEGPDQRTCDRVVHTLRPEFELAASVESLRSRRAQHVLRFTEDQYDALDTMEREPRVLFTGAAGTGKTFLALEEARRNVVRGRSVLLICYNRLLSEWLKGVVPEGVRVETLHALMRREAGARPADDAPATWWSQELPELALEAMLDSTAPPTDVLLVDEAQDLMDPGYLDVLDLTLKGGLSSGTWRMFGDFERQAIFGNTAGRVGLRSRAAGMVEALLGRNCRNTPRVGRMAAILAGLEPGYQGFRRPDDGVNVAFLLYASASDQERLLLTQLKRLYQDGYEADDIVILSAKANGAAASSQDVALARRLAPFGDATPQRVRYCTVQAFKGLDAPAVIITDIESLEGRSSQDLLYIAMTRSTGPLCLLVSRSVGPTIVDLITRGATDA
ncbi:nuclease-related domain-containing DEAD/DEAH box helicase [Lentzea flaviverrucosa]|nr:NERD domain-containing protein [Lentzea flaviverrucosa]